MRDRERGRAAVVLVVTLAVLLALAGAGYVGWTSGRLNPIVCGVDCGLAAVAPPEGLAEAGPAFGAAGAPPRGGLDASAVREAVAGALEDDDLGPRVGFAAMDPAGDGTVLAGVEADTAFLPASTTKVLTAFAALSLLEPQQRFTTRVVRDGTRLTLVGGGDPYLAAELPQPAERGVRADLTTLARATAEALAREDVSEVALDWDDSLFEGPAASPDWESTYVSGQVVTPVSALWVDRGVSDGVRTDRPAAAAAARFASLLQDEGVDVLGGPEQRAPAEGAVTVASVRSATVAQVVEALTVRSDNEAAEVMLRHVARAAGEPASFAGGAAAVEEVLVEAGLDVADLVLGDGSGLARANRISPNLLVGVVRAAASDPVTARLLADLPVGGFTGTLQDRYGSAAGGAGAVRAKTGTLTGVHSLAGVVSDARGVPIAFAVMADDTEGLNPLETQAALDDVAAALAACTCGPD